MIGRKTISLASVTLFAFAVWLLMPIAERATLSPVSPAAAQSDPCNAANFAKSLGRTAAALGADQRQMAAWCRDQQKREASLAAAKPGDGASVSKGPTQLKAEPKVAEIWCGKNNCLCWKGKLHNGCTNLAACATKLNCVGTICGCTTK